MNDPDSRGADWNKPSVALLGARTLGRYTEGILARGFGQLGWDVTAMRDEGNLIVQIHGAPGSADDDREIIGILQKRLSLLDRGRTVVLVHRPDEVQLLHPELSDVLQRLSRKTDAIVHLGDLHRSDPFFRDNRIEIVPHGFFSSNLPISPKGRTLVGSHTTWGEMRSPLHALHVIAGVLDDCEPGTAVGYLGGQPPSELREGRIRQFLAEYYPQVPVEIVPSFEHVQESHRKKVLIVNPSPFEPETEQVTFNIQLYRLGNAVRTGESSGSAHVRATIPVIFEMNGAERIEDLACIRVPYRDKSSCETADFDAAARTIAEAIRTGGDSIMLSRNSARARELSPLYVARSFENLFSR